MVKGKVDGSARGALFDVRNKSNEHHDRKESTGQVGDNILFSEVDTESGWHTDGASKNNVYDVIGLMCINKARVGGELQVTNAANALNNLKQSLPEFLLYELIRPVPRDILENKEFKDASKKSTRLLRSRPLLSERIMQNAYPIFDVDGEHMRFRYMRYWINTGHIKAEMKVPVLLQIAMDLLDDQLDQCRSFDRQLEPGEMIFVNNSILAHNRTKFKDLPNVLKRHQVRAWIQVQKADLA